MRRTVVTCDRCQRQHELADVARLSLRLEGRRRKDGPTFAYFSADLCSECVAAIREQVTFQEEGTQLVGTHTPRRRKRPSAGRSGDYWPLPDDWSATEEAIAEIKQHSRHSLRTSHPFIRVVDFEGIECLRLSDVKKALGVPQDRLRRLVEARLVPTGRATSGYFVPVVWVREVLQVLDHPATV